MKHRLPTRAAQMKSLPVQMSSGCAVWEDDDGSCDTQDEAMDRLAPKLAGRVTTQGEAQQALQGAGERPE